MENGRAALDNYSALYYLPQFAKIEATEEGSFVAFINQLTHETDALIFEAPDYKPKSKVTNTGSSIFNGNIAYNTQMASFKLLGTFFDYLRENGIYDNTRIVIVSDHGGEHQEDDFEKDDALDRAITGGQYWGRGHYHCLLMFKDFNASGDIKFDDTFMTNADTPSIAIQGGLLKNENHPFTGKPLKVKDKNSFSILNTSRAQSTRIRKEKSFDVKPDEWFTVKNDIFIDENWSRLNK